ncbi:MAG: ORF6N domain-containing protein [Opitutaceae bacterium]|jgi:hypothetical protein
MDALLPADQIQSRIRVLRGQRVLLDSDLAALYGVPTKRLNEQVRRNTGKFPDDFCFQLTQDETDKVVANCDHLSKLRFSRSLPYAFTEHGAIQAANVLRSERATTMSVEVVRAFVRLRQLFATHRALAAKLDELDARVGEHDKHLASIIEAIRLLTTPDAPEHGRKIGFH